MVCRDSITKLKAGECTVMTSRKYVVAFLPIGVVLTMLLMYVTNPYSGSDWIPRCLFLSTTGCYCPACGGTRAVWELSRGNLTNAMRQNALVVIALFVVALVWMRWLVDVIRGVTHKGFSAHVAVGLAIASVIWTVARNCLGLFPY